MRRPGTRLFRIQQVKTADNVNGSGGVQFYQLLHASSTETAANHLYHGLGPNLSSSGCIRTFAKAVLRLSCVENWIELDEATQRKNLFFVFLISCSRRF